MNQKKIMYWTATLILFVGMLMAFLPHAAHERLGVENGEDHIVHVINGSILIVFGLALLVINSKWNYEKRMWI
jgi:nitrate reductase gamma subunit